MYKHLFFVQLIRNSYWYRFFELSFAYPYNQTLTSVLLNILFENKKKKNLTVTLTTCIYLPNTVVVQLRVLVTLVTFTFYIYWCLSMCLSMLHNVLSLGLLTSRFPDHIKVGTFVFMYSIFFFNYYLSVNKSHSL